MEVKSAEEDNELSPKLLRKPTLRGLKRCPSKGCSELIGVRSKICNLCSGIRSAQVSQSVSPSSSGAFKRPSNRVIELQNAFNIEEQSKRYFSVREETDSRTEFGVVSLERTMYATQDPPLFSVSCFVPSCVNESRQSRDSNQALTVSCTHGELCLKCNETSKGLTINWEFVLHKLSSMPQVLNMNLITTREFAKGFNYTCQPVQKLDKTSFAVFGPKSTVETHGISHINFDTHSETYQCSCPAFLESGTTNSYKQILGELRVCYHTYMLLAALLSDSNLRNRNNLFSKFCHTFMQDSVPSDLLTPSETSSPIGNVDLNSAFSSLESTELVLETGSIGVHPDLYICNIIHLMRASIKPILGDSFTEQASISLQIPLVVFRHLEAKIAGKLGNDWKHIPPQIVSETSSTGTEKTKKEWEILVAKTFNHFVSFTSMKAKETLSPYVNLEKFFMFDKIGGPVEVDNRKIQDFIRNSNLGASPHVEDVGNPEKLSETNSSSNSGNSSGPYRKLVPTFISSQVIIGRHPITSQQYPCNIQWQNSSPGFGNLQITFHYAKKVNGSFV